MIFSVFTHCPYIEICHIDENKLEVVTLATIPLPGISGERQSDCSPNGRSQELVE